jgi:malate dehydrogenase (oxaloacetate-decarboxylating)(NADP+)
MSQNGSIPNSNRESLRKSALEYHEFPVPGKLSVTPTKQLTNQRDLALAYSPSVAAASEEIVADPVNAFRYTHAAILSRSSPTAPQCWAWARSAPWRPNR